jgi:sigma-B regulation protein RsbU (phosphoserine phosphatase)
MLNELPQISETQKINDNGLSNKLSKNANEYFKKIEAKIISPMKVHGNIKGLLIIGSKVKGGDFSKQDIQFIEALGNTSITALENDRLFKEEVEKKRLEKELELALEIQKNLLPASAPDIPNFDISGASYPSRYVGGDYYDFISLPNNKVLIAIADVSGKGIAAALLMANVQAALRLLAPLSLPLTELVKRINKIICQNTTPDKFVTFFCGILDTISGSFIYVNAGHNPPIWLKKNKDIETLKTGGLIIGFLDEPGDYDEGEIILEPGELLILYTDGVTEAINKDNTEFSEERLVRLLKDNASINAATCINEIVSEVQRFSEDTTQYDDITCVAVRCL